MSQDPLFESPPNTRTHPYPKDLTPQSSAWLPRSARVENSALWAGWADALGFISELTNESGLRRRLKGRELSRPMSWRRRVGGRSGPDVTLPEGTYSDDTQLRLSTSRCIQNGQFDVEAFAHVELPGWLAYALGGGRGTKTAAIRMMGPNSVWYAGMGEGWTRTGGNGAAMRIQPHVWASNVIADRGPWLAGLLADACTTHAHPRALLGAVFHAYALSLTVALGEVPSPNTWTELFGAVVTSGRAELADHPEIGDYWIGAFDAASHEGGGPSFNELWFDTADEMRLRIELAASLALDADLDDDADPVAATYRTLVRALQLDEEATRGSGSTTTIAALWLAHACQSDPARAARLAAADITTDTDTIATMAAALAGAATSEPPAPVDGPEDYSDRVYLISEARRLSAIAAGEVPEPVVCYPDLLGWALPKAQADLVGTTGSGLALAGMSILHDTDLKPAVRGQFVWNWYRTDWGQHMLIKHRTNVRELPHALAPAASQPATRGRRAEATFSATERTQEFSRTQVTPDESAPPAETAQAVRAPVALDTVLQYLKEHGYSEQAVGRAVKQTVNRASEQNFAEFSRVLYQALRAKP